MYPDLDGGFGPASPPSIPGVLRIFSQISGTVSWARKKIKYKIELSTLEMELKINGLKFQAFLHAQHTAEK